MTEKKYLETHEWYSLSENTITIGISDYAQGELGDIVFVELPDIGTQMNAEDEVAIVESVKAASDVYSPVSGEIIEVNELLLDNPETINESPYSDGWFYKIQPDDLDEINELLSPEEYGEVCEE